MFAVRLIMSALLVGSWLNAFYSQPKSFVWLGRFIILQILPLLHFQSTSL